MYFKEFGNCSLNASIYSTLKCISFETVMIDNEKFKCQLKKNVWGSIQFCFHYYISYNNNFEIIAPGKSGFWTSHRTVFLSPSLYFCEWATELMKQPLFRYLGVFKFELLGNLFKGKNILWIPIAGLYYFYSDFTFKYKTPHLTHIYSPYHWIIKTSWQAKNKPQNQYN